MSLKIKYKGAIYQFLGVAYGSNESIIGGNMLPNKKRLVVVYDADGEIKWLDAKKCQVVTE